MPPIPSEKAIIANTQICSISPFRELLRLVAQRLVGEWSELEESQLEHDKLRETDRPDSGSGV